MHSPSVVHAVGGGLGGGLGLGVGIELWVGFCSACCDGEAPDGGVPDPDVPHANSATMTMQKYRRADLTGRARAGDRSSDHAHIAAIFFRISPLGPCTATAGASGDGRASRRTRSNRSVIDSGRNRVSCAKLCRSLSPRPFT